MNKLGTGRKRPLAERLAEHPLFGSLEAVDEFRAGFDDLQKWDHITLAVTPFELFAVLCQVQLAARHPENTGPSRMVAERTAREWERVLGVLFPEMQRFFAAGWDPTMDLPTE